MKAVDTVPWEQRQWGHAAARNTINLKQKLGLGFKQKYCGAIHQTPVLRVALLQRIRKAMGNRFHNFVFAGPDFRRDHFKIIVQKAGIVH